MDEKKTTTSTVSVGGNVGGHVTIGDSNDVKSVTPPAKCTPWWISAISFIKAIFTKK